MLAQRNMRLIVTVTRFSHILLHHAPLCVCSSAPRFEPSLPAALSAQPEPRTMQRAAALSLQASSGEALRTSRPRRRRIRTRRQLLCHGRVHRAPPEQAIPALERFYAKHKDDPVVPGVTPLRDVSPRSSCRSATPIRLLERACPEADAVLSSQICPRSRHKPCTFETWTGPTRRNRRLGPTRTTCPSLQMYSEIVSAHRPDSLPSPRRAIREVFRFSDRAEVQEPNDSRPSHPRTRHLTRQGFHSNDRRDLPGGPLTCGLLNQRSARFPRSSRRQSVSASSSPTGTSNRRDKSGHGRGSIRPDDPPPTARPLYPSAAALRILRSRFLSSTATANTPKSRYSSRPGFRVHGGLARWGDSISLINCSSDVFAIL